MTKASAARNDRREQRKALRSQEAKHGTMRERIIAATEQLLLYVNQNDLPIDPERDLALYAHPTAFRPFALCFAGNSKLSLAELEFFEMFGKGPHYKWRSIPVFELSSEPTDRITLTWSGDRVFDFMVEGPTRLSEFQPQNEHGKVRRGYAAETLGMLGLPP